MYRSSAQIPSSHVTRQHTSTPTTINNNNEVTKVPNISLTAEDADNQYRELLSQKKQQVEEEISAFRAAKEREFKDFKRSLKEQRTRRKKTVAASEIAADAVSSAAVSVVGSGESQQTNGVRLSGGNGSTKQGALGLLGTTTSDRSSSSIVNGNVSSPSKNKSRRETDDHLSRHSNSDSKCAPPLSKPTLSLEPLNINGETTSPAVDLAPVPSKKSTDGGSTHTTTDKPASPTTLIKHLSRSPRDRDTEHRRTQSADESKPLPTPPLPTGLRTDVFTPAYLPLLGSPSKSASKSKSKSKPIGRSISQPHSSSASHSLSLSLSISPTLPRSARARTEPIISTDDIISTGITGSSLPSALRTASDSGLLRRRTRKKVTFQLADRAIVEPSSSYEEMPSPDLEWGDEGDGKGIDGILEGAQGVNLEDENEEHHDSQQDGWHAKNIRSPVMKGREKEEQEQQEHDELALAGQNSETNHSANGSLEVDVEDLPLPDDGGSGIGFFELDEELTSPGINEAKKFNLGGSEQEGEEDEKVELEREGDDDDAAIGGDGRRSDLDNRHQTYEYSGSVPINIVRPMGSWVGSFGH